MSKANAFTIITSSKSNLRTQMLDFLDFAESNGAISKDEFNTYLRAIAVEEINDSDEILLEDIFGKEPFEFNLDLPAFCSVKWLGGYMAVYPEIDNFMTEMLQSETYGIVPKNKKGEHLNPYGSKFWAALDYNTERPRLRCLRWHSDIECWVLEWSASVSFALS